MFFGDSRFAKMSKAGAFDLASGLGGKLQKDEVLSAVEKYGERQRFYGVSFFTSLFTTIDFRVSVLHISENGICFAIITV